MSSTRRFAARFGYRGRALTLRRTSRKGAYLLLVGCIFVVIGLSLALLPVPDSTASGYTTATKILPLPYWGALWVAAGVVGVVTAWWPRGRDLWGFSTMAAFASGWATLCLLSTVLDGADRGWILALIWGQFAAALMIVSGMERSR